jgi:hypothetical protein
VREAGAVLAEVGEEMLAIAERVDDRRVYEQLRARGQVWLTQGQAMADGIYTAEEAIADLDALVAGEDFYDEFSPQCE